jgi:hypothetical protein
MTIVHQEPIVVQYSDYGDTVTLVVFGIFILVAIVPPAVIAWLTGSTV